MAECESSFTYMQMRHTCTHTHKKQPLICCVCKFTCISVCTSYVTMLTSVSYRETTFIHSLHCQHVDHLSRWWWACILISYCLVFFALTSWPHCSHCSAISLHSRAKAKCHSSWTFFRKPENEARSDEAEDEGQASTDHVHQAAAAWRSENPSGTCMVRDIGL